MKSNNHSITQNITLVVQATCYKVVKDMSKMMIQDSMKIKICGRFGY